ncbi:MAG: hypothetical protein GHCLOJNM_03949 [bacterium]|nr:hypothetical protein [bacterium]
MKTINLLVEGYVDETVAARLVELSGHQVGSSLGKQGIGYIRKRLAAFNRAARGGVYLALVDFMDTGMACPPQVVQSWLPDRHPNMILRLAVREVESWLLADREGAARFLAIPIREIPGDPEGIADPKRFLVELARKSKKRGVAEALAPAGGSSAQVGKLYSSELSLFAQESWDPRRARERSPSLDACLKALESLEHAQDFLV